MWLFLICIVGLVYYHEEVKGKDWDRKKDKDKK